MKPNSMFEDPSKETILVPTRLDCNVNQSSFNLFPLRSIHMLLFDANSTVHVSLEVWGNSRFYFSCEFAPKTTLSETHRDFSVQKYEF